MHTGQRTRRDAVIVFAEVAGEPLHRREIVRIQHLAAIGLEAVVPLKALAHPVVHPDVEIARDEHRRLKAIGEIECRDAQIEAFLRTARKEHDVLGVAV